MLWMLLRQSWKLAIALLVGVLVTTFLVSLGRNWSNLLLLKVASFTFLIWITLWLGNSYLTEVLDRMASWTDEPVKRLIYGVVGMIVFTLAAVYFIVYFCRFVLNFDVSDDLNDTLYSTIIITTLITMFMTGRSFLINWKQAAVNSEKLKRESVKAQYESLKNQVNPHFLFNSLNALTNLVYQDQDKAAKFIKELSDVYRYVLDSRDKELVTLEDEMKFLNAYFYLQQIRFGDKLRVEVHRSGMHGQVAPLALQMLVENAIKHNIISEENPLTIKLYAKPGWIVVENNLQRKRVMPEESPGLGLENIRRRYEFLTNEKVAVVEQGNLFQVSLPMIEL